MKQEFYASQNSGELKYVIYYPAKLCCVELFL